MLSEMLSAGAGALHHHELTRKAVQEEMSQRMDTGIRVNKALKAALLGGDGGHAGNGRDEADAARAGEPRRGRR